MEVWPVSRCPWPPATPIWLSWRVRASRGRRSRTSRMLHLSIDQLARKRLERCLHVFAHVNRHHRVHSLWGRSSLLPKVVAVTQLLQSRRFPNKTLTNSLVCEFQPPTFNGKLKFHFSPSSQNIFRGKVQKIRPDVRPTSRNQSNPSNDGNDRDDDVSDYGGGPKCPTAAATSWTFW